ncbi:MAG: DUF11 domain-containing protein, partial [Planctomycetaceae bacterium]
PTTSGARQTTFGGGRDAFVVKYNANATGYLYATYLGGNGQDEGLGLALDTSNRAVVVGKTTSTTGFPLDAPLQGTNDGGTDAFVTKVSSTGTTFVYSTYLGGSGNDEATGITVDSASNAYLTGWTASVDFLDDYAPSLTPIQLNNAGAEDAFVVELNNTGATLIYRSYVGGSGTDKAYDIALDTQGFVHITGETSSTNYPKETPFPDQETLKTPPDAFLTALNLATTEYFYSSYLGGSDVGGIGGADRGLALAVDATGSIYATGETASGDFPLVNNAFQRGGGSDAFIVRVGSTKADLTITKTASPSPAVIGQSLTYTIRVSNAGPDDTSGVQVQDPLPPQVAYVSATTTQGTCSEDGGVVTCDLGDMVAGAPYKTITIQTTVLSVGSPEDDGDIVNTASITQSSEFDPNTPNDATVSTPLAPDLVVTKTADDYRLPPGSTFTFTIEVTNVGGNATSVRAFDLLSSKVDFVSAAPSVGTYNDSTGFWIIGTLGNGQSASLDITVTMNETATYGDTIPNTVIGSSFKSDMNPADNSSTVNVAVASIYPEPGCHPSPDDPATVICLSG